MNEDRFRTIIREEMDGFRDNLATKADIDSRIAKLEKTVGSMLANAIEPLVTKIDRFGEILDQSDESRASLLALTEKLVISYERLVDENRELRDSIRAIEQSVSEVTQRLIELENRAA